MPIVRVLLAILSLACVPWAANAAQSEADALRATLDHSSRPEADKARDAGRKPADVVAFLGFGEGMTVLDVIAAGGYYTEVLSIAVGDGGKVYAQNPSVALKLRDGANDKALTERLANDRLPNVVRLDREFADIGLEPESLDGAITALNFHDVYNNGPEAAVGMLQVLKGLLKSGGVLGIIDHAGDPGADNAALHRIEKDKVIEAAKAAGFKIAGDSDLLSNPGDDHTGMVFAPELRGNTDRFLLKLAKPG
jgi:predicted methyltransferase